MAYIDFILKVHNAAKRDYVARVTESDKAQCATISKQFGFEYFDGDRKYGYGGFRYDGRWLPVAQAMIKHYGLPGDARILDVGCAKGFLVHDFMKLLPGADAIGLDISEYAIANAMPEVKDRVSVGNAVSLPYPDKSFDLVVSINTLHNLRIYDLEKALKEIERVGKKHKYICVESYRNEEEKANLLYWQLTCEAFNTPAEWEWWFKLTGYAGDCSFIYFE